MTQWERLRHALGPATDVPGRLADLRGSDAERFNQAADFLATTMVGNTRVYSATGPVVSEVATLVRDLSFPDERVARLVTFLRAVASTVCAAPATDPATVATADHAAEVYQTLVRRLETRWVLGAPYEAISAWGSLLPASWVPRPLRGLRRIGGDGDPIVGPGTAEPSAQDTFRRTMAQLAPMLRESGLTGSGQRWQLPSDTHWLQVGIQRHPRNTAFKVEFTVNLSAIPRAMWFLYRLPRPDVPKRPATDADPPFGQQTRLGVLTYGWDVWWSLRPDTPAELVAAEVAEDIGDPGLAWLRGQRSVPTTRQQDSVGPA
ncbi:MAG: DUF4304 domain-containing protein [Beutenbergiaceae bacterium]